MPEVALVPLPLILVDQEGFKAFLQALVDIPKLLQVLRLLESIRGRIIVMLRSKWTSIRLNPSLASDAFPWGAGHGTLRWTRASEQAGKALRSQGHQCAHVM